MKTCVYYPLSFSKYKKSISSKQSKANVFKLYAIDSFILGELTNTQSIKEAYPNSFQDFFYLCTESKQMKIASQLANEDDDDKTILLTFEPRELISFEKYLKTLGEPKQLIHTFIQVYIQLLDSIQLLTNIGIVHNNLLPSNILMTTKKANTKPVLSHFYYSTCFLSSSSFSYSKVTDYYSHYQPDYIQRPLELHLLSYLLTNKLTSLSFYNIETVIDDVIHRHDILKSLDTSLVADYKKEALHYFTKYINQPYSTILTDIIRFYPTWDNYALSIVYLQLFTPLIQTGNRFVLTFTDLLVTNIHLNPSKRLSIYRTRDHFIDRIESLEPRDYLQLFQCIFV